MDVLGVVTGSIRATTLASGEAADVFDIMDCTASVPAQIMRSDMDAQHSYVDGTVLAIKGAKLAAAAHGRITLVAPEANVKLWPRAQHCDAGPCSFRVVRSADQRRHDMLGHLADRL